MNIPDNYEIERIVVHRVCTHGILKYLVYWKGYGDETDTWEEQSNLGNAPEVVNKYWKEWELALSANNASETVVKDLQGELECPHFHNEPEWLYRKKFVQVFTFAIKYFITLEPCMYITGLLYHGSCTQAIVFFGQSTMLNVVHLKLSL